MEPPDELDACADGDGIVCLPALGGESTAEERVRRLLATAYGGQWNSHLADEVAACAIAHRAAVTQAPPAFGEIVPRGKQRAKWMEELDGASRASSVEVLSEVGIVTVQEEVGDVGVFWLP